MTLCLSSTILLKGDNFADFLFAFMYTKSDLLLKKKKIAPQPIYFFKSQLL